MCEAHFEKQPVRKYITVLNISDWGTWWKGFTHATLDGHNSHWFKIRTKEKKNMSSIIHSSVSNKGGELRIPLTRINHNCVCVGFPDCACSAIQNVIWNIPSIYELI